MVEPRRKLGNKVRPRAIASIETSAQELRDELGLHNPKVKICALLEMMHNAESITLAIEEDNDPELANEEARAWPDKMLIKVKQSVHHAAAQGKGHAVFTLAHELGHIVLHRDEEPSFARGEHKIFEDSEWQADAFASAFLMDSRHIDLATDTVQTIADRFGTSLEASALRLRKLRNKMRKAATPPAL